MWPFCACTMKNMQFGAYLWPNRRNSCVLKDIGVGERDGDVRFLTESRNMAVLHMRNENYPNWPLSVADSLRFLRLIGNHGLVNSAMGQIPCSTERISCYHYFLNPR